MTLSRKLALFGSPASGSVRPQDLFSIVTANGAQLNTAIDALSFEPSLVVTKPATASGGWVARDAARGWSNALGWDAASSPFTYTGYSNTTDVVAYCWKRDPLSFDYDFFYYSGGSTTRTLDLSFDVGMFQLRRYQTGATWYTWQKGMSQNTAYPWDTTLAPWSVGVWANGNTIRIGSGVVTSDWYMIYAWPDNPDLYDFGELSVSGTNQGSDPLPWVPQYYHLRNKTISHKGWLFDTKTANNSWPMCSGNTVSDGKAKAKETSTDGNPVSIDYVTVDVAGSSANRLTNTNLTAWDDYDSISVPSATTLSIPASSDDPRVQLEFTGVDAGEVMVLQATLSGSGTVRMGIVEEVSSNAYSESEKLVTLSGTPVQHRMGRLMRNGSLTNYVRLGQGVANQAATVTVSNVSLFSDRNSGAAPTAYWSKDGVLVELTWNTSDKVNMTLSNNNLTAERANSSINNAQAYGDTNTYRSHGAGKFAYEIYINSAPSNSQTVTGFGWVTDSYNKSGDWIGQTTHGFAFYGPPGGGWHANNALQANTGTITWATGDRVQLLFDMSNNRCWFTKDGINYYGANSTPVTKSAVAAGTGGFAPFSSGVTAGSTYTPALQIDTVWGTKVTANFGTPILASYPTGFSAYGPVSTGTAPTDYINSSFLTWAIRTPT